MNTREAYAALAAGKVVRAKGCNDPIGIRMDDKGRLWRSDGKKSHPLHPGTIFEIFEAPATDAELVAAMRSYAEMVSYEYERRAYKYCADMLEKRSVKP